LAAVLAVQILPGHFQMAFVTEVGVLTLAIVGAGRGRRWGTLRVVSALAAMIPLAAAQLVPTLALARLSARDRGFEYLSGFAASPIHLVSYVAPGLFHRSPLWRPLAWDLFHTSPEEYLGYLGLVPLFLAIRAMMAGWRSSAEVRALALVAGLTLILSLGPYFPGFRWLIALPGFSFFRAPARWSLGTALALAGLAGLGFDAVRRGGCSRKSVLAFAAGSTLAIVLVVGGFELAIEAARGSGRPEVASGFDRALKTLPWADEPNPPTFRGSMVAAYRPQSDSRVQAAQARLDGRPFPPSGMILARERWGIYARELSASAVMLMGLLAVGWGFGNHPRRLGWALLAFTALDLTWQGRSRPFDLGPTRPLVEQSPVLARAALGPRGLRTLDPGQNLFLVAGADAATAYRTLNLPDPGGWLGAARGLDPDDPKVSQALQALGIEARILDPSESRAVPLDWLAGGWGRSSTTIRDPTLAGWLYGADFARLNRLEEFRWVEPATPPARAWRVDAEAITNPPKLDPPSSLTDATPLNRRSPWPERVEVDLAADPSPKPGWVVVSQTFDPEWSATWVGPTGERPATVVRVFEGWQGVDATNLPPGNWTLRLEYQGRAARWGLAISAIAWLGFILIISHGWNTDETRIRQDL